LVRRAGGMSACRNMAASHKVLSRLTLAQVAGPRADNCMADRIIKTVFVRSALHASCFNHAVTCLSRCVKSARHVLVYGPQCHASAACPRPCSTPSAARSDQLFMRACPSTGSPAAMCCAAAGAAAGGAAACRHPLPPVPGPRPQGEAARINSSKYRKNTNS
jgi:hypothetical protein